MTCMDCGRDVPVRPQHVNVLVAHVCPAYDDKYVEYFKPCWVTPMALISENLQQRTFDRDEWWDL